ncbi:unnamed protein product, partial [Prorocentrum cordatum]
RHCRGATAEARAFGAAAAAAAVAAASTRWCPSWRVGPRLRRRPRRGCRTAAATAAGALPQAQGSPLVEVTIATEEPAALAELLLGLGASAATVTPAAAAGGGDPSLEVMRAAPGDPAPLWRHSEVTAMFDCQADLDEVARAVQEAFELEAAPELRPVPVEDKDWVTHVQQLWEPLPLGSRFEVRLPWHPGPPGGEPLEAGRVGLRLEGGAAFGLGD